MLGSALCDDIVTELSASSWTLHSYYDSVNDRHDSPDENLSVSFTEITQYENVVSAIRSSLNSYVSQLKFGWFSSYKAFCGMRFNRYTPGGQMEMHCDHIHSMFDGQRKGIPILSVVGLLNDDFLGGRFVMFEDREIPMEKGDILVFPSNFLFPHSVEPILEGTRHSFVSWAF